MTTGTSTWKGLGMGLQGEYELTQITAGTDMLTLTAAESASGISLVIQTSDKTPAVNGLRFYPYGRTRIIRTDAASTGGAFNNALDVKVDLNYAAGAQQYYAATFIYDNSGGSAIGGREACIQLQYYGNTSAGSYPEAQSFIHLADLGTTEVKTFMHILGSTIGSTGMMQALSSPGVTHGLVMYWENTKYWIMVTNAST